MHERLTEDDDPQYGFVLFCLDCGQIVRDLNEDIIQTLNEIDTLQGEFNG
jgi:hypothetical protein